ncbi:sugar kinase [Streptomyces scopuliridis]|uniref:sugar kinase n=1 Tax=Streptomyces scopuliridis TaxID=452529 RepID=UPI00389B2C86
MVTRHGDRPRVGRAARSPRVTGTVDTDLHPGVGVVCLGESMVTFLPSLPGRLADVPSFARTIGGAESNVACALAAAGHTVKWVSRVGADGFGDHLVDAIAAYGVDTSGVRRDPDRPTGIYFRTATDRATDAHEVAYYRAGSAASAMAPGTLSYDDLWAGRVLHVSGITAALSDDCLALMRELTARAPGRPLVSFDVNHRPGLWRDGSGARVLLDLARGADLVFVGEDEAADAWDLHGGDAIRAALPEPATLVVKRGSAGATVYEREVGGTGRGADTGTRGTGRGVDGGADTGTRGTGLGVDIGTGGSGRGADTVTSVPALRVDVVAPVGAGDAFAAGFLSATLRGLPAAARLRHGHLMAAATLTVPGDLGTPPSRADADRLADLDDAAWGTLRLGPGWTAATEQEVRTP